MIFYESLTVETSKQFEVIDLTDKINNLLENFRIDGGLINLWVVHTTAALTVNENDKELWTDMLDKFPS